MVALVVASLAIPAGILGQILVHDGNHERVPADSSAPMTVTPTDASKARVGTPAPDFTLESADGTALSLSDLRGHPVVIAFFASWCHPCEEELPVLQDFARADAARLRVIAVSFRDLKSDSVAFVRRLKVTFPALLDDPSAPVAARYGVLGIPQTIFVDGRGIVRGRVYGQTSRAALQPAMQDLLRGVNIRPV
jgi:peroxiredoxin